MILTLPMKPDTKMGDEALQKWKREVEQRLQLEVKVDPDPAKTGLKGVADEADKTAKATKGIFDKLNAQAIVAALGPIKDILAKTGVEVFGLSEGLRDTFVAIADMASQGAQMGAAFGPVGIAIGGVAGGLLQVTKNLKEFESALPATAAKLEELRTGVKAQDQDWLGLNQKIAEGKKLFNFLTTRELPDNKKAIEELNQALKDDAKYWSDAALAKAEFAFAGGTSFKKIFGDDGLTGVSPDDVIASLQGVASATLSLTKATKTNTGAVADSIDPLKSRNRALFDQEQRILGVLAAEEAYAKFLQEHGRIKPGENPIDGPRDAGRRDRSDPDRAVAQIERVKGSYEEMTKLPSLGEILGIEGPKGDEVVDRLFMLKQGLTELAASAQDAFVSVGSNAAKTFFNQLEKGKVSLKDIGMGMRMEAVAFLKDTGSKLVGQGVFDLFKAASLGIVSAGLDPRAGALGLLGGAEVAGGLAMGGAGALLGRGIPQAGSLNAPAPTQTSTQFVGGTMQAPPPSGGGGTQVHIHTGFIVGDSEEARAKLGQHVERAMHSWDRAGPKLRVGYE